MKAAVLALPRRFRAPPNSLPADDSAMRWPIHVQLLVPLLSVVLVAIAVASLTSAAAGSRRARQQQEQHLERVVTTLLSASFPLTDRVLEQMSGLSGAEFVLLDDAGHIRECTLPWKQSESPALTAVATGAGTAPFSSASRISLGGTTYLGQRVEVRNRRASAGAAWLVVLYPEDRWWAATRQAAYPALISGALAALAVVAVTALLARRLVRPIHTLGDQTAVIASGRFEPVGVPPRDDEIRDLAVSINSMAEQLSRYEDNVRRSERLRALGQLGAGLAHQLRNSATGARMAIELHALACAAGGESLDVALRQLRLMESYIQRFLTLGRPQDESRQEVEVGQLVAEVLELVAPLAQHAGVAIDFHRPSQPIVVCGDREALGQLVVNLAVNAIEAARRTPSGPASVAVALDGDDRGCAVLRVADSGAGVAAGMEDRIFEPFASDKPEGTGLGLFVAREVARAHGGTVTYEPRDGKTVFRAELPRRIAEQADGAPADCR